LTISVLRALLTGASEDSFVRPQDLLRRSLRMASAVVETDGAGDQTTRDSFGKR